MAVPVISSVSNSPQDGKNLLVTLGGAPTGTLKFYASRTPGSLGQGPLSYTGTGPYQVLIASTALAVATPFYLTARDDEGDSVQAVDWLCKGSSALLTRQVSDWLYNTIWGNRAALDKALQNYLGGTSWPNGNPLQVETVTVGPPQILDAGSYPLVAILPQGRSEDWFALPYGKEVKFRVGIHCYAVHALAVSWEQEILALGDAVFAILNQLPSLEPTLPCGIELRDCKATSLDMTEEYMPPVGAWVSSADIAWEGTGEYGYPAEGM